LFANTKELTYDDILFLQRIEDDTVVERFGSKINSAFLETANLLGTLKLKGFVDIVSSPGLSLSKVSLTKEGHAVLQMAEAKAKEEFNSLDLVILKTVSRGARNAASVESALNIRSSDLAFQMNKLQVLGFIDYTLRRGEASISLTTAGFNRASSPQATPAPAAGTQAKAPQARGIGAALNPFKSRAKPGKSGRAPTIMDELTPSEESETGLKPTPEELKKRMRQSKFTHYKAKWGNVVVVVAIVIIILLMAAVYTYLQG